MNCIDIIAPEYLLFSTQVPKLLYYSHIPVIIFTLFFTLFLLRKLKSDKKNIGITIFIFLCLVFGALTFSNLISWTSNRASVVIFSNIFTVELINLFFTAIAYLFYLIVVKKTPSNSIRFSYGALLLLSLLSNVTFFSIKEFNLNYCELVFMNYYDFYQVFLNFIPLLFMVIIFFRNRKKVENNLKNQNVILFFGFIFLYASFFVVWHMSYFLDMFFLEQVAFLAAPVFFFVIGYVIAKSHMFNIKLVIPQVLTTVLLATNASLFFIDDIYYAKIVNIFSIFIVLIFSVLLIRSVKKVDEQKELLALANQEQEALLHFITHQIKGFFTKSRNIFSTLKDGDAGKIPDSVMKYVEEGLSSDESGIEMVQNILNASSLKTGKVQFNKKTFDVCPVVSALAEKVRSHAEMKGLKLNVSVPTDKIEISGDALHLENAFRNLFENAINYTQQGEISIDLSHTSETIILNVKDTGMGLSDADKSKLFSKGGRGDEARKINVNSTGYGLYIVKQIISEHNGFVEAHSEGRGKGSVFTVKLPLHKEV